MSEQATVALCTERVKTSRPEKTKEAGEGLNVKKTCERCLVLQRKDERGMPGREGGKTVQLREWNTKQASLGAADLQLIS